MKIGLWQMNIMWEDKEKNYSCLEEQLKLVRQQQIELFLLPEMSFTGFSMNTNATKEDDYKTVKIIIDYAKKYNVAIGFGWVKDCGEKSENHYSIVDKNGDMISDYAKIHPFSFSGEDRKFRGGNKIASFELNGIKFSNFICYDLRFPEIFRMVSKTADAILLPANWPKARREHWRCLLRARAIENQVYIIAINCVGKINGISYSGDSCIINPNGDILAEISDKEGILEHNLINDVQEFRDAFPIQKDRKENWYYEEYKNIIKIVL